MSTRCSVASPHRDRHDDGSWLVYRNNLRMRAVYSSRQCCLFPTTRGISSSRSVLLPRRNRVRRARVDDGLGVDLASRRRLDYMVMSAGTGGTVSLPGSLARERWIGRAWGGGRGRGGPGWCVGPAYGGQYTPKVAPASVRNAADTCTRATARPLPNSISPTSPRVAHSKPRPWGRVRCKFGPLFSVGSPRVEKAVHHDPANFLATNCQTS